MDRTVHRRQQKVYTALTLKEQRKKAEGVTGGDKAYGANKTNKTYEEGAKG